MTEHLENEILHVLALYNSKPVRRTDTLQELCDILRGNTRKLEPIVWEPLPELGCMNWN